VFASRGLQVTSAFWRRYFVGSAPRDGLARAGSRGSVWRRRSTKLEGGIPPRLGNMSMAKEASTQTATFWRMLFSLGFYKRSQGRIARQATFAVLAVVVLLAGWSLLNYMPGKVLPFTDLLLKEPEAGGVADTSLYDSVNNFGRYMLPLAVVLGGFWLAFRAMNIPQFADFLISVEAEMNKVSWPSRLEMYRSAIVVIITIFGLAFLLFGYDVIWQFLLRGLGVLKGAEATDLPE
jgi:preprotein translocase subunit SecE